MDLTLFRSVAELNASLLRVPIPTFSPHPSSFFTSPTMFACLSADGSDIAINADISFPPPAIYFTISHEMRHLWQLRNGMVPRNALSRSSASAADYNRQPHEIDANAWGVFVTRNCLGLSPKLWESLGQDLWQEIDRRSRQFLI